MAPPWSHDHFRVASWHADPTVASVALRQGSASPSATDVVDLVDRLTDDGYLGVMTAALRDHEAELFAAAGFLERERLAVLSHDLRGLGPNLRGRTRRGRRTDRSSVIAIDHSAFQPEWQLDESGLRDAIAATPRARFRVAAQRGEVTGYAVSGRAGRTGFIQRLAVSPDRQSSGLGQALVVDALLWLRDRATLAMVNTQLSNERALDLYSRLGFAREPSELSVLVRRL
jgi:ribosomal protein S18 acetylase RimI-like enzyme